MKILSAEEIRLWDQYTFKHEPIASIDLMERAASQCTNWISRNEGADARFHVFCGKGNNGGDGLAIARQLAMQGITAFVYVLELGQKGSVDFRSNLSALERFPAVNIIFLRNQDDFPEIRTSDIIIDALFGSGLSRELEGITASLVKHINQSGRRIISIDIPSGMFVDRSSKGNVIVRANQTLSFQCLKPAFLVPENADFTGEVNILDIGLHPGFYESAGGKYEWVDESVARSIYKPRKKFAHKGNFGRALILAGSKGRIGAAVLAARACLRSGVGLLFCHLPSCGYEIMQTSLPEAMVIVDDNDEFNSRINEDPSQFDSIGIGPGLGTAIETKMALRELLDSYRHPLILDADALNLLASQKDLLKFVPAGSVLTPHPREFERLFGESANDFDRIGLALQKSRELQVIIVLKGHYSFIATPDHKGFFNSTGNAGMATAGSGDVLTGILTGLLAQGYSSVETALLGVYLHGLSGDIAAGQISMEAMIAGDIIDSLGKSFKKISQ